MRQVLPSSIGRGAVLLVCLVCMTWRTGTAEPTAFVGASVFGAPNAVLVDNAAIVVDGERFVAFGAIGEVDIPDSARIVDVSGKWIVPGLIDSHVHFFQSGGLYSRPDAIDLRDLRSYDEERRITDARIESSLARYIASGITSVADVGGPFWNFEVRRRARAAEVAPRMNAAGPLLGTWMPEQLAHADPAMIRIKTKKEARAAVRAQIAQETDLVKIWLVQRRDVNMADELGWVRAAVKMAHKHGVRVAAHATQLENARAAVLAGVDILVHSVEDARVDDDFIALLRARGTIYITTVGVYEGYWKVLGMTVTMTEIDRRVGDPAVIESWSHLADVPADLKPAWIKRRPAPPADPDVLANLRTVLDAGITVAAGSDAGNPGSLHGPALHREFQLMAEAGLSPAEILTAATRGGAKVMARETELGVIAPGYLADFVVLEADPLADIRNAQRIYRVVKGGRLFDPDQILADLAAAD